MASTFHFVAGSSRLCYCEISSCKNYKKPSLCKMLVCAPAHHIYYSLLFPIDASRYFSPPCCRVFQCRCTMMSFSNSIKGGAYSNLRHFLLVSLCASIMENSEHISPGKGAFPGVASASIAEAVLLLCYLNQFDLDLLSNSPCTTTKPFSMEESFL